MLSFTPHDYAKSLGLKPGMNVGPSRILDKKEMVRHEPFLKEMNSTAKEALIPFWREFASLYLPSLLRTFFDGYNIVGDDIGEGSMVLLLAVHTVVVDELNPPTRDFHRFLRARPEEAVTFFHIICKRLAYAPDPQPGDQALMTHFRPYIAIASRIFLFLGYMIGMRPARDKFTATGKDLPADILTRFAAVRRHLADNEPNTLKCFGVCIETLEYCMGPKDVPDLWTPEAGDPDMALMSVTCELFPFERYVEGRCVKPAEGMEMPECARCHCVRYCSRAHQKAHWKTHKSLCFPPGW